MNDLVLLSPIWLSALTGILVMLIDVMAQKDQKPGYLGYVAATGLGISGLLAAFLWRHGAALTTPFLTGVFSFGPYSLFFGLIVLMMGVASLLIAPDYLNQQSADQGEFYILTAFSASGMLVFVAATDLIAMFVGLETMSLSIYAMAASNRNSAISAEAGMKYFILGGLASSFLLMGVAFLYGVTGSTNIIDIGQYFMVNPPLGAAILPSFAMAMIIIGLGFKIAAVPFHFWTPDVYQGSPTPVTIWMAGAVKAAGFAVLARLLLTMFHANTFDSLSFNYKQIILILALLTMTYGNIVGIVQTDVKRILAYSSIAHAGYILLGVYAVTDKGFLDSSVAFYLLTYAVATIASFGVVALMGGEMNEDTSLDRFAGFGRRHPMLGLILTISLLSLAGIPPFAGFAGKFYLFKDVMQADVQRNLPFVIFALVNSLIAVYYYLRIIVSAYMEGEQRDDTSYPSVVSYITIGTAAVALIVIGVYPSAFIEIARIASTHSLLLK